VVEAERDRALIEARKPSQVERGLMCYLVRERLFVEDLGGTSASAVFSDRYQPDGVFDRELVMSAEAN
jgi:hypothetical protein